MHRNGFRDGFHAVLGGHLFLVHVISYLDIFVSCANNNNSLLVITQV